MACARSRRLPFRSFALHGETRPLPAYGRPRPGKALPRRRKMGPRVRGRRQRLRPLPQRRRMCRLPPQRHRFAARAVHRARHAASGTGTKKTDGSGGRAPGLLRAIRGYASTALVTIRKDRARRRAGSDRLADHGPGVRSLTPSLGFPIFRQRCSETLVRWCKMRAARGPRMLLGQLVVPAEARTAVGDPMSGSIADRES